MGKSGSFFFFSSDKRLLIKTVKNDEIEVLKRLVPEYYDHVIYSTPNSLLSRIYGFYEIQIE